MAHSACSVMPLKIETSIFGNCAFVTGLNKNSPSVYTANNETEINNNKQSKKKKEKQLKTIK